MVVDIFNGRNDLCDCGGQFNNGRNDLHVQTNSEANYPGFMSRNDLKNNIWAEAINAASVADF